MAITATGFDVLMLIEEFIRAGMEFSTDGRKMIDVQKIFHQMEQRTLSAAYKFYCGKTSKMPTAQKLMLLQPPKYWKPRWSAIKHRHNSRDNC